jgi:5-formyltetrahydrofolate cyclo-ligase
MENNVQFKVRGKDENEGESWVESTNINRFVTGESTHKIHAEITSKGPYTMLKEEARKWGKNVREMLSVSEQAVLSKQLAEQFKAQISLKGVCEVHSFLPIPGQNEVDSYPILSTLGRYRPDIGLSVPYQEKTTDREFFSVRYKEGAAMRLGPFGMQIPLVCEQVAFSTLDMAIIPLLAYDGRGYRVGYGGGYYDRFLSRCRPDIIKIGVSYFGPIPLIGDTWPGDIALDAVLSPKGIAYFTHK